MASDITQASLSLTPEERRVYGQLFQQADTESLGVVTGDVAVKFFERTKLDPGVLGEIWQIADTENRGLLTPAGFSLAMRLIGHCQAGKSPSLELAKNVGPLPKFDGAAAFTSAPLQAVRPASPLQAQVTGGSISSQPGSAPIRVPPLTGDKVVEYQGLFEKAGARNGLLSGDAARQMFERSRLPNDILGRIWSIADIEQRGALNLTEFIIAMHLLTSMRNGSLRALPQTLPAGLYEAAARRGAPATPPGAILRQFTGQQGQRTQSPLSRSFSAQEIAPQPTGTDWLVTPQDKAKFDAIFATLDTSATGFVNGDQAVQFFSNSGISEDNLASIWDLADMKSEGRLNKDEFAVAMFLIRQHRGKTGDRENIPSRLPAGLIPPSMRQQQLPPSQPTAPAFDNAAFATGQPRSASEDLFGLDALAGEPSIPQKSPAPALVPTPIQSPILPTPTGFKPFQPTSSFGQNLAQQHTGPRQQALPNAQPQPQPQPQPQARTFPHHQVSIPDDLLGDNDPEVSKKLTDETTELANISNQVRNLRTQTQELQTKKQSTESNLSVASNQKRDLEARLGLLRNQYEQELRQVKALEERLNASRSDTQGLQKELAMIEGTYQDLREQHQQSATALEADQRENVTLRERTSHANAEVVQMKSELEKMKADVRQQKGLVAINKKQLAASESEREKLRSETAEVQREQTDVAATLDAQREAQTQGESQIPSSGVASPASSSTNPFFRRAQPGVERAMSPSIFTQESSNPAAVQNNFDDFFGPSPAVSQPLAPQPPPQTASNPQVVARDIDRFDDSATSSSYPLSSQQAASPSTSDTSERQHANAPPLNFFPPGMNFLRSETPNSSVRANPTASHTGLSNTATPVQFQSPSASVNGDTESALRSGRSADSTPGAPHTFNGERAASPSHEAAPRPLSMVDDIPGAFPNATPMVDDMPGAFPDTTPTATPDHLSGSQNDDQLDQARNKESSEAGNHIFDAIPPPTLSTSERSTDTPAFNLFPTSTHTRVSDITQSEFPAIEELNLGDSGDSESESGFGDDFTEQTPTRVETSTLGTSSASLQSISHIEPIDELPPTKHATADIVSTRPNRSPVLAAYDHTTQHLTSETSQSVSTNGTTTPFVAAPSAPVQVDSFRETPIMNVPSAGADDDFDADFDDLTEAKAAEDNEPLTKPIRGTNEFSTDFEPRATAASTTFGTQPNPGSAGAYHGPPSGRFSNFVSGFNSTTPAPQTYSGGPKFDSFGSFSSGFGQTSSTQFSQSFSQLPNMNSSPPSQPSQFSQSFSLPPSSTNTFPSEDESGGPAQASHVSEGSPAATPQQTRQQVQQLPQPQLQQQQQQRPSQQNRQHVHQPPQPQPQQQQPVQQQSPSASSRSHDWDTMFSGLQNPSTPTQSNGTKDGFGPSPNLPSFGPAPPPPSAATASSSKQRPTPGRALSTGTEHDDPILKSLTGMGYGREDALKALERYDYNIDKAADYLSTL